MCGIIGYIGKNNCKNILVDSLKKLEYRGYDSSGIALINNRNYKIIKSAGRISNLENKLQSESFDNSNIGIGHTRWATHGISNDINAHPHEGKTCILVHNGIIENYKELKDELLTKKHSFYSDVDSEVIAKLIDDYNDCPNLNIIFKNELDKIYVAKKSSPLVVGINKEEKYICSDINSVSDYCKDFIYLPDNSLGIVNKDNIELFDFKGNKLIYEIEKLEMFEDEIDKKGYDHFMLKEIEEEPTMFENILKNNLENDFLKINIDDYKNIKKIVIIGCGSAMHAGLIGKYYLEKFAKIDTCVEVASEYRYKDLIINKNTLAIFISQSGETADTLACIQMLKEKGIKTLSFINVYNSSIAKLSDKVIYTTCGKEIAIASTKALIGQILYLILFSLKLAYKKRKVSLKKVKEYTQQLKHIPYLLNKTINNKKEFKRIVKLINKNKKIIFIGRGIDYYIGLESSLKLKEITYIPSMCYQAGELKHGPISLIDDKTLVFVINTNNNTLNKTDSNKQEVLTRNGNVYCISTLDNANYVIEDSYFSNTFITLTIFQLIAYYTALSRNLDIDKPRNLAKSVTVE